MHPTLHILIITLFIAGCGNKGPLYLPGQKPPSGNPATSQPAPPADATTTKP